MACLSKWTVCVLLFMAALMAYSEAGKKKTSKGPTIPAKSIRVGCAGTKICSVLTFVQDKGKCFCKRPQSEDSKRNVAGPPRLEVKCKPANCDNFKSSGVVHDGGFFCFCVPK